MRRIEMILGVGPLVEIHVPRLVSSFKVTDVSGKARMDNVAHRAEVIVFKGLRTSDIRDGAASCMIEAAAPHRHT